MAFKSDLIEYYKQNIGGQNYYELPDGLFKSISVIKGRSLVEPITFDKYNDVDGVTLVYENLPYIRGKIIKTSANNFKVGSVVIYNSNILSFLCYENIETGDLLISIPTSEILLESGNE